MIAKGPEMRVAIAGAGNVGPLDRRRTGGERPRGAADRQGSARHQVRHAVDDAEWLLADACELSSLEEAGLDTCDVAIAATGDDKANLVMSLLAKTEFGVPRTVGRVNHPKNEWLFNEVWGVDVAVSTPRLMSALVEEAVTVGDLVRILTFHEGETNLVEMTLPASSPCVGQRIGDLTWPGDVVLVAIIRDGHARAPDVDGSLESGDELLFVTAQDYEKELAQMLSPRDRVDRRGQDRHPADPTRVAATPGLPGSPSTAGVAGRWSSGGILHRSPALGQHQSDHRQGGDQQWPAEDDLGHAEPDHLAGEEQRQLDDEPGDVRHGQHQR